MLVYTNAGTVYFPIRPIIPIIEISNKKTLNIMFFIPEGYALAYRKALTNGN